MDLPDALLVVLNGWEWPGDRLVRLPVGSRDVTIDGPQQTLCQAEVAELVEQVAAGRGDQRSDHQVTCPTARRSCPSLTGCGHPPGSSPASR